MTDQMSSLMKEQIDSAHAEGWVRDMVNVLEQLRPLIIEAIQDLPHEANSETKAMIGGVAKICHYKAKQIHSWHESVRDIGHVNQPNDAREFWRDGWDKRGFDGYPYDLVAATLGCLLSTSEMLKCTTSNDDFQISGDSAIHALVVMLNYADVLVSIFSSIDFQTTAAA